MNSELAAAAFDDVFQFIVSVVDIELQVAHLPWRDNGSEIPTILPRLHTLHLHPRSVAAQERALTLSLKLHIGLHG